MKRDIRELFNDTETEGKKLPKNHRTEFIEKLNFSTIEKPKKPHLGLFLKVAASIALIITFGYYMMNQKNSEINKPTSIQVQVQQIEKDYLQQIDNEWKNFVRATDDKELIKVYQQKLDDLNEDYKELSKSFKENTNNVMILEDLIGNLQNRLQLLKDIQNHIKILNEKTNTYETLTL